jgi:hypothetical protein
LRRLKSVHGGHVSAYNKVGKNDPGGMKTMGFLRTAIAASATALLAFAFKKMVGSLEKQAEATRVRREEARDPNEFKRLKQDPKTGVYYAED